MPLPDLTPDAVIGFWIDETGPAKWFAPTEALDQAVRDRFGALWHEARCGRLEHWKAQGPRGVLAYLIVTDQFPRNMFRDNAHAHLTDALALAAARAATEARLDMEISEPGRQIFYLPFTHSEDMADQDRCVALFRERMPGDNIPHSEAHRETIRRFGRFPWRNDLLVRDWTTAERAFVDDGGYGRILNEYKDAYAKESAHG